MAEAEAESEAEAEDSAEAEESSWPATAKEEFFLAFCRAFCRDKAASPDAKSSCMSPFFLLGLRAEPEPEPPSPSEEEQSMSSPPDEYPPVMRRWLSFL